MNLFEKIYFDILWEAVEGEGDLYHATDIFNTLSMLKEDAVKLTLQVGAEGFLKKAQKLFFLSTSRVKYGRYVHGGNYKHPIKRTLATIDISKANLKRYGVPFSDVDYWGDEFKKLPNFQEEQEVRIFHSTDKLAPISQFVSSIHVCIGLSSADTEIAENIKEALLEIQKWANLRKVPCFFYTTDNNSNAYKGQFTQKAISDLPTFLNKFTVTGKQSVEDRAYYSNLHQRIQSSADSDIENIWNVYVGKIDETNKKQKRLLDTILYYPHDALPTLEADFHNAFRKHPPHFKLMAKEMKRLKMTSTREFIKHIIATVEKRRKK